MKMLMLVMIWMILLLMSKDEQCLSLVIVSPRFPITSRSFYRHPRQLFVKSQSIPFVSISSQVPRNAPFRFHAMSIPTEIKDNVIPLSIGSVASCTTFAMLPTLSLEGRLASAGCSGLFGYGIGKYFMPSRGRHAEDIYMMRNHSSIKDSAGNSDGTSASIESDFCNFLIPDNEITMLSIEVQAALEELRNKTTTLSLHARDVDNIARRHGVLEGDLSYLYTFLLSDVLRYAVDQLSDDISQLQEVISFVRNVGFDEQEIGSGLSFAALYVGRYIPRDERGFLTEDFDLRTLTNAGKLYFLAEKLRGSAFDGYYGKQFKLAISYFLPEELKFVVTKLCKLSFTRHLQEVLISPHFFTRGSFEEICRFYQCSSEKSDFRLDDMMELTKEAMDAGINAALSQEYALRSHVGDSFDFSGSVINITQWELFASVTGVDALFRKVGHSLAAELMQKAVPYFDADVANEFYKLMTQPYIWKSVSARLIRAIAYYNLDRVTSHNVICKQVVKFNQDYARKINGMYQQSEGLLPLIFKNMKAYSVVFSALQQIVNSTNTFFSQRNGARSEMAWNNLPGELPLPSTPLSANVLAQLYEIQLELRHKNNLQVKVSTEVAMPTCEDIVDWELSQQYIFNEDLFELPIATRDLIRRRLAVPKVVEWVKQCLAENIFDDQAKNTYMNVLENLTMTDYSWSETAADLYYQQVNSIASIRKIPSEDDILRLYQIARFLNVSSQDQAAVHLDLFGPKYVDALIEAIGLSGGPITPEYSAGLEKLRNRLCLTSGQAKKLLALALRLHLKKAIRSLNEICQAELNGTAPVTNPHTSIMDEPRESFGFSMTSHHNSGGIEVTSQRSRSAAAPGSSSIPLSHNAIFMREALSLIELFEYSANINAEITVSFSGVGDHLLEEGNSTNAVGLLTQQELASMYKHYLFSLLVEEQESLRKLYSQKEAIFADILGIPISSQKKLKISLMNALYKQMISGILQAGKSSMRSVKKPSMAVDEEERISQLMPFEGIRSELKVDDDDANIVFREAMRDVMHDFVTEALKAVKLDSRFAGNLRAQIQKFGVDMISDLEFSPEAIGILFALEVQHYISIEGDTPPTGQGIGTDSLIIFLDELVAWYKLPLETAQYIVAECARKYSTQIVNVALFAAKKYQEKEAKRLLRILIRFASYHSEQIDADGSVFDLDDLQQLLAYAEDIFAESETPKGKALTADRNSPNTAHASGAGILQSLRLLFGGKISPTTESIISSDQSRAITSVASLASRINLDPSFVSPVGGMDGLRGVKQSDSQSVNSQQGSWGWGGGN